MHLTLDSMAKADLLDNNNNNNNGQGSPRDRNNNTVYEVNSIVGYIDNSKPLWGIMLTLQENLNLKIGTQIWKKYINAAFWNYISTPINFTITLFTAMSAGQTGTDSNYLTKDQLFYILFISFILSIINTFFKLKDKAILNYDSLKKYQDFGAEFEKIYFTNIQNETILLKKYYCYLDLQSKLNTYESTGSIEQVNYITEVIYLMVKCCFSNRMKRINYRERFWVLDGRPKDEYKHNYYANVKRQYKHNFDIVERIGGTNNVNKTNLAIDMTETSNNIMVTFDVENPPPALAVSNIRNPDLYEPIRMNGNNTVPHDEDLTDDDDDDEEYETENGGQKDNNSEYTEKNTITKEYIYNALDLCYIKKNITEYDMIKRIMAESDIYDNYLHSFKVRKYLRRLGLSPVLATNEMNRLSKKIKNEYEKNAKKEKELFNKTHGKKGIPPVNVRLEKEKPSLRRFQF